MDGQHLVVVGLMGSGKTTVGRALAAALGRAHRDSDLDLLAEEGRTARAIDATDGLDRLHALELRHLLDALREPTPAVISAAASVIDDPAGRAALAGRNVAVVWLRIDPETADRRRAQDDHRPSPEPLAEQARRRDPWFRSLADVEVDARQPVETIVADVLDRRRDASIGR